MPTVAYIGPTWFLHQTAHDEGSWASDNATSGTATQSARELSTDQRYAVWWHRLRVHKLGDFCLSRSPEEVRKSTREREIHHYLSVLCACGCELLMLSANITYALAPFSKDRICFDPAALWPPFWFHCSPSLLSWRSRFCWLTWQRVDIYIYMWEEFRNVYLLMTWVWPAFLRWPCVVDGTLKSNYYYYCTRLFCMALVERLGDDSW